MVRRCRVCAFGRSLLRCRAARECRSSSPTFDAKSRCLRSLPHVQALVDAAESKLVCRCSLRVSEFAGAFSYTSLMPKSKARNKQQHSTGDASEALATRDSPSRPDHDHTLHYHRLRVRRLQHKNDLWFNQAGHTSPLYDDKAVKGGRAHKAGPHRQLPFFRDVVRSAKHIVFVLLSRPETPHR
ncbi:hypothetical protein IWZ00DRAFT_263700 [Phyllosticta capitalensis]